MPYDYTRLLFAALLGWVAFGELPTLYTWIGAAVIVASAIYIARREALLDQSSGSTWGPADRGEQHRGVVGEAEPGQEVRQHVGRHHEIGERAHQHRLGAQRRRRIDGAIIGGERLAEERDARGVAAQLVPEAGLDPRPVALVPAP